MNRCLRCWQKYRSLNRNQIVFGDPWLIENCDVKVVNPGYEWDVDEYWDEPEFEETLILQHDNGAGGLLWDFTQIFHFEAA